VRREGAPPGTPSLDVELKRSIVRGVHVQGPMGEERPAKVPGNITRHPSNGENRVLRIEGGLTVTAQRGRGLCTDVLRWVDGEPGDRVREHSGGSFLTARQRAVKFTAGEGSRVGAAS